MNAPVDDKGASGRYRFIINGTAPSTEITYRLVRINANVYVFVVARIVGVDCTYHGAEGGLVVSCFVSRVTKGCGETCSFFSGRRSESPLSVFMKAICMYK